MTSQILRVSVRGDLPGGEVWSVNPCWEIDGFSGSLVSPAQALTIATALGAVTVPSVLLSQMAPHTRVTGYRVEARKLTGELDTQAEFVKTVPNTGTGSTAMPFQTSLVVTLRTPLSGASYRGRLYWPLTGATLATATSRLTGVAALLTGFKTYLAALEAAIQVTLPNANLTVWSRTKASFTNVNSIQLGDVPDVQRRRRDALLELYTATSYPV